MYPHWTKSPQSENEWFEALMALARYLRGPEGCPWDREQGSKDFARFAAEEAEELRDAFSTDDNSEIEEEFGDAMFCLLAAAAAAESEGRFTLQSALQRIHEKMIRRHEHVFGENRATTPEEAIEMWNRVKAEEKQAKAQTRQTPEDPPAESGRG
jgi:tetrapyrrole methylase family protein / MazG family protein